MYSQRAALGIPSPPGLGQRVANGRFFRIELGWTPVGRRFASKALHRQAAAREGHCAALGGVARWLAGRMHACTAPRSRSALRAPNRLIRRLDAAIMPLEDGHGPPAALFPVPLTLIRVPCDS